MKLECVPKFCNLGDTLGAGGGVGEAARARVRCAWAKFKELSPILTLIILTSDSPWCIILHKGRVGFLLAKSIFYQTSGKKWLKPAKNGRKW